MTMLGKIFGFRQSKSEPSPTSKPETPPVIPPEDRVSSETVGMLNRQVVMDKTLRPIGYQFSLRDGLNRHRRVSSPQAMRLYDEVLIRNFVTNEAANIFGNRLIFLPMSIHSCESKVLSALPADQFVLMLHYDERYFQSEHRSNDSLFSLKEAGFRIGFSDFPMDANYLADLALADFVRVSIAEKDVTQLSQWVNTCARVAPEAQLIASDVQFFEEMHTCLQMQFHYLQGQYFRHRDIDVDIPLEPGYVRLLEILNMVRRAAEPREIASALKTDPLLVVRLLAFVNSAAGGLTTKVDTIERALIVLGHQKLYRWLTLLIFSHSEQDLHQAVLLESALIRARFMELIGRMHLDATSQDQLFTTGMFSLMEGVLKQPMPRILSHVNLPAEIADALLQQTGPYAAYLQLAKAVELGEDEDEQARLGALCHVSPIEANRAQMEALLWAQAAQ